MKSVLVLPFLLLSFFAQGQSYRCIIPGEKAYFTNTDHYLRGIRIDSTVTVGAATVYYPFRSLRGNPEMGSSPLSLGGAWVGDKITEYPDGTYLVTNTWNDTIVIRTQANVGEIWNFYTDTSAIYYRAEVISKSLELVDGITDSVKTIEIRAFHRDTGYIPSDPSNGLRIGISKSHGFYELLDLFMFPHRLVRDVAASHPAFPDTTDAWFHYSGSQQFRRITLIEPTKLEMYNYEVGDVLQYRGDCVGPLDGCDELTIDTCIAKEILSPESVKYTFSRFISQRHFGYGPPTPPTFISTTRTLIADTSKFLVVAAGELPEEAGINSITYYNPFDTTCFISAAIWGLSGSVFNFHEPCGDAAAHKVGLGQTRFSHCDDPGGSILNKYWELVYSLRTGVSCGSFVSPPNKANDIESSLNVQMSPNPANNNLLLIFTSHYTVTFQLMDIFGKIVKSGSGNASTTIDVSDMPPGTYFIIAHNSDGHAFRGIITVFH